MNKAHIYVAASIAALLVVMLIGMRFPEVAKGNPFGSGAPAIGIFSPSPGIYRQTSVELSVWVSVVKNSPRIVSVRYCLDEGHNVTVGKLYEMDEATKFYPEFYGDQKYSVFFAYSNLNYLTEGNHTLRVYSQDAVGNEMSRSVEFRINTHYVIPKLLILSPENKTYTTNEVPLNFTCDQQNVSSLYSLDNEMGYTSLLGNTTLTGLSSGIHTIKVTVWDEIEAVSQTVSFTIAQKSETQTSGFLGGTLTNEYVYGIVAFAVISAAAITGYLFLKRKKKGEAK